MMPKLDGFAAPLPYTARARFLACSVAILAASCSAPEEPDSRSPMVQLSGEIPPIDRSGAASGKHLPVVPPVADRGFQDPPLPPELLDDGGLEPLPPPPHPSAMAGTAEPIFQAPQ